MKKHGKGIEKYNEGGQYEGQFKDGVTYGYGRVIDPSGNMIEGEYKDDKLIHGTVIFSDGSKYEGQFKDFLSGHGTITESDGLIYEGKFKDGAPFGQGKLILPDGAIYEGKFKHNLNSHGIDPNSYNLIDEVEWWYQLSGHGTITDPDGSIYEGEWKSLNKHGKGIQNNIDGSQIVGYWLNGVFSGRKKPKDLNEKQKYKKIH